MNIKPLIIIASLGIIAGLASVVIYNEKSIPQPPLAVSDNPYTYGIYATGIIESFQPTGSNINMNAQVTGPVMHIAATPGQTLKKGDPILMIDDRPQRSIVARDVATLKLDQANIIKMQEQLDKISTAYTLNVKSISRNTLDNAINAVDIAKATFAVDLEQYRTDQSILDEYTIRAPQDGVVLRIIPAIGDLVSPQGSYDTYTQGLLPSVQMGAGTSTLQVRAYVDEILIPRLPDPEQLEATLFVRGLNNKSIPLQFIRIDPYAIPNIELSDQRNERVDVRVLPILFQFKKPKDIPLFPGQLVDVYLKGNA